MSFEALVLLVLVALAFDFMNGFHDAANSIATIVSTRVLRPQWAVVWAAFFNFVAFLIFGVAVAATIGKGIIDPLIVDNHVIFGALIGAITWNVITWYYGIPSSSSHALIGGLAGAAVAKGGVHTLIASGFLKTAAAIVLSPALGFVLGIALMLAVSWMWARSTPRRVDRWFRRLQLVSAALYSIGHGGNDAQKTMGIIWMLLISAGTVGDKDPLPLWVVFACYGTIAMGTLFGGWRIVKTMGQKITQAKAGERFLRRNRRRDHAVSRDRARRAGIDHAYHHRRDRRRRLGAEALGGALGGRRQYRVGVALHHSVLGVCRSRRLVDGPALLLERTQAPRNNTRPGRAPVALPSRHTTAPLTMTVPMPRAGSVECWKSAASITVSALNSVMSA